MADRHTGKLTSDRVRTQLDAAIARNEDFKKMMSAALSMLPGVLERASREDLTAQLESLTAARTALDKAIASNATVSSTVQAAAGQLNELREVVTGDTVNLDLRNIATLIYNERVFFECDPATIRAVLEIVDPAIFAGVFAALPPERQIALLARADAECR